VPDDDVLQVAATTRGLSDEDGGYLWRGELRLWDNELLIDGKVITGWAAMAHGEAEPGRLLVAHVDRRDAPDRSFGAGSG
jgi:hypothetical protein